MMGAGGQPIIVLSQGTKRESGHHVQIGNITACKVNYLGITYNISVEILFESRNSSNLDDC